MRLHLNRWLSMVVHIYHPSYAEKHLKQDCISKITNTKKAGGMVQVVECLPSKHKVLSLIPSR
jgi:hypothetical protein